MIPNMTTRTYFRLSKPRASGDDPGWAVMGDRLIA